MTMELKTVYRKIPVEKNGKVVSFSSEIVDMYPIDAYHAIATFPLEWSDAPWMTEQDIADAEIAIKTKQVQDYAREQIQKQDM